MKTHQIQNLLELATEIARAQKPSQAKTFEIPRTLMKLQKIAVSLHKRYEADCSYQWADTDAYRARTERLEFKAGELVEALGLKIQHQRDPRGWPLILNVAGAERRIG